MESHISPDSKAHLLIAWISILLGSALPELVLGLRYPVVLMHGLSLLKCAFFIVMLILTFFTRKVAPLRSLFAVLLTLHVAMGAFGTIVSSSFWKGHIAGFESQFVRTLLSVQLVRVGVTLAALAVLFALYRTPSRFYFGPGHLGATASRVAWLGISGKSSWNRVGIVLTAILSLGTLAFLSAAMTPAVSLLPGLISTLPIILLFSVSNALGEEIIYRLALLAPTIPIVPPGHAMMMSAVYFGLAHYYGIPSGWLGVVMAGFLGWLACRSVLDTKGVAWAFAMHFVQDIWIYWFLAAMLSPGH